MQWCAQSHQNSLQNLKLVCKCILVTSLHVIEIAANPATQSASNVVHFHFSHQKLPSKIVKIPSPFGNCIHIQCYTDICTLQIYSDWRSEHRRWHEDRKCAHATDTESDREITDRESEREGDTYQKWKTAI